MEVTEIYCRKCMKILPSKKFFVAVDGGFIDSNKYMSVCKDCIQTLYDNVYKETNSFEKTIHKLCIALNIRYSNDAMSAARTHIETMQDKGKNVKAFFAIYKMKLLATQSTMDKSASTDMSYEDVGTIFITEEENTKDNPIPKALVQFWGEDFEYDEIQFLETNYTEFKKTHSTDTYAEVILLKQVCYTMLNIQDLRSNNGDTGKAIKELQELMKNLAISPNAIKAGNVSQDSETLGLWIQDIEKSEPAQWLLSDPRGDMYRDVGDVDAYFQKYIVRPLKNFITGSKDFNIDDDEDEQVSFSDDELDDSSPLFSEEDFEE